jgi:penicillin-binding protein 2
VSLIENKNEFNRFDFFWSFFYFIFIIFLIKLINFQIIKYQYYKQLAEKNKTQIINQNAPRGRIITCDGEIVASNKASYSLIYFPNQSMTEQDKRKLASLISLYTGNDREKTLNTILKASALMRPAKLVENMGTSAIMKIAELKNFYSGLQLIPESTRYYPYNNWLSHIIGYMGKIDSADWKLYSSLSGYNMDSMVGKTGVEKKYEQYLKGQDGGLYMEIDNKGRLVRVADSKQSVEGGDVYLTLDFRLQKAAEEALDSLIYKRGVAIALDPDSGKILVYAVKPGFDLNSFVTYREEKDDKKLSEFDEFNLGVQATYPPASTFKVISTIAALESGRLAPEEEFYCPGYFNAGDRIFKCWDKKGHKKMNMIKGLANSCDVYYYNLALKVGPLEIENIAKKFRLGMKTGVDLSGERDGNLFGPSIRARKKSYWFIGDTLNMAIGQGETLVTPIQMAVFISAIASKGRIYRPYYVDKIVKKNKDTIVVNKPYLLDRADLKEKTWEILYQGLKEVVESGTGQIVKMNGIEVYAKTGTAQNPHGKDHAWFICFAKKPDENPKIAIAVLIEHGEHGSSSAAPVAKAIIKAMYNNVKENENKRDLVVE